MTFIIFFLRAHNFERDLLHTGSIIKNRLKLQIGMCDGINWRDVKRITERLFDANTEASLGTLHMRRYRLIIKISTLYFEANFLVGVISQNGWRRLAIEGLRSNTVRLFSLRLFQGNFDKGMVSCIASYF